VLVSAYLFALQASRFLNLSMGVRDLGFFVQSLWNTLQGSFLAISIHPFSQHLWGFHFYLVHILLIPLYALWPSPLLLLAVQAGAVGVTGWCLYLLGRLWLSRPWMAAVVVLAYTLHPQVHWAAVGYWFYGYHPEMLFPPLFVLAVYFLVRGRTRPAVGCWLLALAVREEFAVVWMGLGLFLALRRPTQRLGVLMITGSGLWLALATLVVIPLYAGGRVPFYFSGFEHLPVLGKAAIGASAIWRPVEFHLAAMLRPLGFLPLLDPFSLIAAPMYGLYAAAWSAGYVIPLAPGSVHNSAIIPVLAVSALRTLGGISWFGRQVRTRFGEHALVMILLMAALLPLACWICGPPLQLQYGIRPRDFTRLGPARRAALGEIAQRVPNAAVLSTDFFTGSQFLHRPNLQLLQERWDNADYVLVDRLHDFGGLWPSEGAALRAVQDEPGTVRVLDREGFLLLRRARTQVARPPTE